VPRFSPQVPPETWTSQRDPAGLRGCNLKCPLPRPLSQILPHGMLANLDRGYPRWLRLRPSSPVSDFQLALEKRETPGYGYIKRGLLPIRVSVESAEASQPSRASASDPTCASELRTWAEPGAAHQALYPNLWGHGVFPVALTLPSCRVLEGNPAMGWANLAWNAIMRAEMLRIIGFFPE